MKRPQLNISLLEEKLSYSGIGVGIMLGIFLGSYISDKIMPHNQQYSSLNKFPLSLGISVISALALSVSLRYAGKELGRYLDNRNKN